MKNYLYLICAIKGEEVSAPCKVGISQNPAKRLKGLQTAYPYKLIIYELWDFSNRSEVLAGEELAHASLAEHRLSGEWFSIEPKEALFKITLWFKWAAAMQARERGDIEPLPPIPPNGVGLIANGLADRAGKLRLRA